MDVVVVGGANTDFLVHGPSLPTAGTGVEGEVFQEGPGGKGANQAVAAARLGAKVAFVSRVGADDRGTALLRRLRAEGVDVDEVSRDPKAATAATLVMVDRGGQKQTMAAPGANHCLSVRDVAHAADLIASARVLLVQLELQLEVVEAAIRLARAAGARVVLDPAPARSLPQDLLEEVHLIRPNAFEAETITGIRVVDRLSARKAAENLLLRGAGAAVIGTSEGSLLLTPEDELWFDLLPVRRVDTTGAGDAFSAAMAVSLARGESLAAGARFANAAAALATTRLGAQAGLPSRDAVEDLLIWSEARPAHL